MRLKGTSKATRGCLATDFVFNPVYPIFILYDRKHNSTVAKVMRLINATTLALESFNEDAAPPYVILSHTWGSESDEVTLQEMKVAADHSESPVGQPSMAAAVRCKPGFIKIKEAARMALSHECEYIWVDTCCIDKTSSSELSEAINSMFKWYQAAEVCLAYLSDVAATGQADLDIPHIKSSRWFTRGWTLQELIAPDDVRFYSQDWSFLGSKSGELRHLLFDITGIEEFVLNGVFSIEDVSIAQRMQWASKRRTTRQEDMAYCLMGLFNVNMPLLYGEGERAFIRLQDEIIKGKYWRQDSALSYATWTDEQQILTINPSSSGCGNRRRPCPRRCC